MPKDYSEYQLCEEFKKQYSAKGYTIYPEVDTYDMLLTSPETYIRLDTYLNLEGWQPNDQIGIQAKLNANMSVICQCIYSGPKWRAVLVPWATSEFNTICRYLGIGIFEREQKKRIYENFRFAKQKELVPFPDGIRLTQSYFKPFNDKKLKLPPIVPDLPAGLPSPSPLSTWRVGALKLCTLLNKQGYLTKIDFEKHQINFARWLALWLDPTENKVEVIKNGKPIKVKTYIARKGVLLPSVGWEKIQKQIEESEALQKLADNLTNKPSA